MSRCRAPLLHATAAQCAVHYRGHADSHFHPGLTYFYRPPPPPQTAVDTTALNHPRPSHNDQPQLQPCARHSGSYQSRNMLDERQDATTLAVLRHSQGTSRLYQYTPSSHALRGLARGLARGLRRRAVTCVMRAPAQPPSRRAPCPRVCTSPGWPGAARPRARAPWRAGALRPGSASLQGFWG